MRLRPQHPSIYTVGKRGQEEDLLGGRQELARLGAEVFASPRGGQVGVISLLSAAKSMAVVSACSFVHARRNGRTSLIDALGGWTTVFVFGLLHLGPNGVR